MFRHDTACMADMPLKRNFQGVTKIKQSREDQIVAQWLLLQNLPKQYKTSVEIAFPDSTLSPTSIELKLNARSIVPSRSDQPCVRIAEKRFVQRHFLIFANRLQTSMNSASGAQTKAHLWHLT
jgi:hypothetical protein